jgi:hypothetical protein
MFGLFTMPYCVRGKGSRVQPVSISRGETTNKWSEIKNNNGDWQKTRGAELPVSLLQQANFTEVLGKSTPRTR